jgi:hypothetical protein
MAHGRVRTGKTSKVLGSWDSESMYRGPYPIPGPESLVQNRAALGCAAAHSGAPCYLVWPKATATPRASTQHHGGLPTRRAFAPQLWALTSAITIPTATYFTGTFGMSTRLGLARTLRGLAYVWPAGRPGCTVLTGSSVGVGLGWSKPPGVAGHCIPYSFRMASIFWCCFFSCSC